MQQIWKKKKLTLAVPNDPYIATFSQLTTVQFRSLDKFLSTVSAILFANVFFPQIENKMIKDLEMLSSIFKQLLSSSLSLWLLWQYVFHILSISRFDNPNEPLRPYLGIWQQNVEEKPLPCFANSFPQQRHCQNCDKVQLKRNNR